MRIYNWILLIVFFTGLSGFSQEKFTKHTVEKGETVSKIAKQYNVNSNAIYELNPKARNGIKFQTVLLIPIESSSKNNSNSNTVANSTFFESTHEVLPKETLYGIAKQYGITVKDLYNSNPTLENSGLKIGDVIRIKSTDSNSNKIVTTTLVPQKLSKNEIAVPTQTEIKTEISKGEGISHEVLPKETLYGIAKQYGVTVSDLDKVNPGIISQGLKIGQTIKVPVSIGKDNTQIVVNAEMNNKKENSFSEDSLIKSNLEEIAETVVENKIIENEFIHVVLPKETKYGIAKDYGISVKELERQNPKIIKKLRIGNQLTIRSPKLIVPETPTKDVIAIQELGNEWPNYNLKSFHGPNFVDQLVATASDNIGVRYRTGGTSKDGFDCSGLMCTTFGAFDIQLPRTSFEQSQYGEKINNEEAQKGDLIFFKTNGRSRINHVGMVVEVVDGDIKFIHASVGGGVIISSIKEKYYMKKVTQINRVF